MEKRNNLKKTALFGFAYVLLGVAFSGCGKKRPAYSESEREYQARLTKERRREEKKELARLKKRVQKIRKKKPNKAKELKENVTAKARQIGETLRDKASAATDSVKSGLNSLHNKAGSAYNYIKDRVKGAQDNHGEGPNEHHELERSRSNGRVHTKGGRPVTADVRGAADISSSDQGKNSVVSIKIDSFKKLSGKVSADEVYISCPKGYEDSIVNYLDISTSRLIINDHEYRLN